MGSGTSKLTEEQLRQVKQLVERWANDQDHQTNTAMRTQYNRVTELVSQFNDRLTNRQSASEERLERQVRELQEQLEKMQKKVDSNEPGTSGNQINELLNGLANTLKPVLDEKKGKNFDDFAQKAPYMNFSGGPMGSQGFGPVAMNQHYAGPMFGYFPPNPNGPPNPAFQQNYNPHPGPMPYQQQYPPNAPPNRFAHPLRPMNAPNQQYPNQNTNATNGMPAQFSQNQTKNENLKSQKGAKKLSKAYHSTDNAKNQEQTSGTPKAQNENKGTEKNMGPKITIKDTPNTSKQQKIKLEDVQKLIAEFKRQQIENDQEEPPKHNFNVNLKKKAKQENKNASTQKWDPKSDGAEKKNQHNAKRCDTSKTEPGDRRDAYKSRGRGRGTYQQWKDKNRQARKKSFNRNINNDEADSDSNESVSSNFSSVSKASTVPANKNKRVFWTTRPNYARNYNLERVKLKLESITQGLDLENYAKSTPGDKSDSRSRNESSSKDEGRREEENVPEKRDEGADANKQPSASRDSNLKVLNYPSKETALREGRDLYKPLAEPALFIGLTETGEHRTYSPKCLADIYALEEEYKNCQLISLA